MRILPSLCLCVPLSSYAACNLPQHDQFDFWLGQWQVYYQGKLAGLNSITEDLDNCVIREHYRTESGYEGRSLNIYDAKTERWHQTWTDNTGLLLQLDGQYESGTMVLKGHGLDKTGQEIEHKISWTPLADDTVRQHWQIRSSNEHQWQTVFDGDYRPMGSQSE
ncbi:hypothetical protein HMF8227_02948 [Saliniradius amylolyticus]|uniref:DUF1579 domain-containing protein n=1 Tax=Saliniradius amylolyticus TaxID=2183582 RepID=A0A2S2E6W4_9ALTE|nr:hypothetical protein [Saliniradius amylolyticus]AWL13396.1 hypothetical protein HMF8227_02948 [Saliniradius amylolyticus]